MPQILALPQRVNHHSYQVRMAERSKALRSGRSPVLWAWVRIPLLTIIFHINYVLLILNRCVRVKNFTCHASLAAYSFFSITVNLKDQKLQHVNLFAVFVCPLQHYNKNFCGRDGRTICGPQCVPKSTCVSL